MTLYLLLILTMSIQTSCSDGAEITDDITDMETMEEETFDPSGFALITGVEISGESDSYTFNVGISSPDTGCDQYADWWEVFDDEGTLLHRRVLGHSHVNEQPFFRTGGPINIAADRIVIVRAHMNNNGYGRQAYRGSVSEGFEEDILPEDFHLDLDQLAPLPTDCAF